MVSGWLCLSGTLAAQSGHYAPENRPGFYYEKFQAGAHVGFNRLGFDIRPTPVGQRPDSITGVSGVEGVGLHISIAAEYRLSRLLTFRFEPGYLLGQRAAAFDVKGKKENYTVFLLSESDLIRFPVALRLRSKRTGNFASYMLTGLEYDLDVAGNERKIQQNFPGQQVLRLKKHNLAMQVGSGLDFFLPYFKFGVEIRFIYGLRNIHIPDDTPFSRSVDGMRSRALLFSVTFEG